MLTVFRAGRRIVQLSGGWLYPLFVLYLASGRGAPSGAAAATAASRGATTLFGAAGPLTCEDTKIGQGAVFLYAALGIRAAHGTLTSGLAAQKADALGIELCSQEWVESLECRTESLLHDVEDPAGAIEILEGRLRPEFLEAPQNYVSITGIDDSSNAARAVQAYLAH